MIKIIFKIIVFSFGIILFSCQEYVIEGHIKTLYDVDLTGFPIRANTYIDNNNQSIQVELYTEVDKNGQFYIKSKYPFNTIQILPGESWSEWQIKRKIDIFVNPRIVNEVIFPNNQQRSIMDNLIIHNAIKLIIALPDNISNLSQLVLDWDDPVKNVDFYSISLQNKRTSEYVLALIGIQESEFKGSDIDLIKTIGSISDKEAIEYISQPYIILKKDIEPDIYSINISASIWNEQEKLYDVVTKNYTWRDIIEFK